MGHELRPPVGVAPTFIFLSGPSDKNNISNLIDFLIVINTSPKFGEVIEGSEMNSADTFEYIKMNTDNCHIGIKDLITEKSILKVTAIR